MAETTIEHNLRWACQWLALLHRSGFPTLPLAEAALVTGDPETIRASATRLVEGTRHLNHPSLVALRLSLAADADMAGAI